MYEVWKSLETGKVVATLVLNDNESDRTLPNIFTFADDPTPRGGFWLDHTGTEATCSPELLAALTATNWKALGVSMGAKPSPATPDPPDTPKVITLAIHEAIDPTSPMLMAYVGATPGEIYTPRAPFIEVDRDTVHFAGFWYDARGAIAGEWIGILDKDYQLSLPAVLKVLSPAQAENYVRIRRERVESPHGKPGPEVALGYFGSTPKDIVISYSEWDTPPTM
jgi:hypothetical protein